MSELSNGEQNTKKKREEKEKEKRNKAELM
jgi:hypothetical protein